MTSTAHRFRHVWARALVVPVVLFVVTAAYLLVVAGLGAKQPLGTAADQATTWRASYSRRFPRCVALVLWPRYERPAAVLVREPGRVSMMTMREAVVRLRLADTPHEVELVGACRAEKSADGAVAVR